MCRLKENDFSFPDLSWLFLNHNSPYFTAFCQEAPDNSCWRIAINLTRLGTFHGHLTPVLI